MPYHHGLLNQPDPDPPWGRPRLPPSLLAAVEQWGQSPEAQMDPLLRQQEMNRQRAMAGDPNYASIGPRESQHSGPGRILDNIRHVVPRAVGDFAEGFYTETPRGLLDLARTLGAESVGGPGGWITDIIDSPSSPRAPETRAGRAGGMFGLLASEIAGGLGADAAAAVRGVRELRDPEGSTAIGSLELLSAVPGFGLLATGPLRTARMAARIEAEAAARAAEAAEVARRAARDAADPFDDLGIRASTRVEPSRPPPGEAAEIGPLIARDAETGLLGRGPIDELSDDTARRILYAVDRQGEWGDLSGPELREALAAFEAEDPAEWAEFLANPSTRLDVPELRTGAPPPSVAEGTPLVAEIGGGRSLLLTRNTYPDQGPWRITPVSGDTGMSRGQHWHYETYDEAAQALAGSADDVKPLSASGGLLEVTEAAGTAPPNLASLTERARALDPAPSTVRAPRPREGLEGVRTAGTPGRGIASVRELDQTEAVRQAQRGAHLVRGTDGQYVGAPRGMNSPGALRALRRRLDSLSVEGESGRDWYDRAEAGNLEIAGPHADRTALLSAEEGLWSAGATPDVNLGFAISGHNAYEAGAPLRVGRWPRTQGQRYIDARDAGGVPGGGPKTGVYGGHLDPFVDPPITGTNDIWHARAFGYTNADGSEFSRGLSPQEHAFMDAETLLSAERMNASRGTDAWDARGSQAAIWVRMKGAALAEEKGWTLAEGIAEARKIYPDYFDKNTLSATYEAVPGVDTGHLPGIQGMTLAQRQAYTDEVPWTTQAGNDVFADELGMYSQRTTPGTGYFEGDVNPNLTARPLIARSAEVGVDPRDAAVLTAAQATRGLLDSQNASAWHHVRTDAKAGQETSAVIGLDRAATSDEMRALEGLSEQHIPIDTGTGITLMADPTLKVAPSSRDVLKRMEREWKPAISDAGEVRDPQGLPYGPPRETNIPGATGLERVAVNSNYQSLLELKNAVPGGGVVTDEVLRLVDEADALAPTTSARLSAPSIRRRAGLLAERDDLLADTYGGVREDVQNFRRIFAEKGLAGIRAAREAGVALPAWVLAFLGANELRGEREGG